MLNIHDLEARHKKYKLKSFIPYVTIFISLSIISTIVIILLNYKTTSTVEKLNKELVNKTVMQKSYSYKQDNNITKIEPVINAIATTIKEEVVEVKKENLTLSPSMNFVRKIQGATPIYYNKQNDIEAEKTKQDKKIINEKRIVVNIPDTIAQEKKEPVLKIEKKNTISINRKNSDADKEIQHVIKRFKVNHNPALSLFIAKKYYQLGKYDKAYNYALITNDINNNIEASWIIFAKSLIKLNKKEMAIKTLNKYINHSHSSEARILLDEILSGKFK